MRQCINPDEIRPGDLSAYVDGEAEPRVAGHVRRCAFCAGRAAAYRRMNAALVVALDRAACPAAETLGNFCLNALPAGQKLVVAKHLAECARCAAELPAFDRPASTDDWLAGLKGLTAVLKGVLVAAPIPFRPQAAARGDVARQRYYQADGINISIGYRSETDRRGVLIGVILAPAASAVAGLRVELFRGDEAVAAQVVDSLGHFVFEAVAPGAYDLAFDWGAQVVLVTGIRAESGMRQNTAT